MAKPSWLKLAGIAVMGLAVGSGSAFARTGSARNPIVVHMKRGTDRIRLKGVLRQGVDCCTYKFVASAGQTLVWKEGGAAVRMVLQYPDGHTDGPGLPARVSLPASGAYLLSVSPDLMADGAFGRFTLTLGITPLGVTPGLSVNGDNP
jgi:hypothetical protein